MADINDPEYKEYQDYLQYAQMHSGSTVVLSQAQNPNQVANNIEKKSPLQALSPEMKDKLTPSTVDFANKVDSSLENDTGRMATAGLPMPMSGLVSLLGKGIQGGVNAARVIKSPLESLERLATFLKGAGTKAAPEAIKDASKASGAY